MRDEIEGLMQKLDLEGKKRRAPNSCKQRSADPDFWSKSRNRAEDHAGDRASEWGK